MTPEDLRNMPRGLLLFYAAKRADKIGVERALEELPAERRAMVREWFLAVDFGQPLIAGEGPIEIPPGAVKAVAVWKDQAP